MPLLAEQTHVYSSPGVMVLFVAIMLLTYVGVAHKKFHKTVAALLGGGVLTLLGVLLGVFQYDEVYQFLAKDLNVFGVIIGTGPSRRRPRLSASNMSSICGRRARPTPPCPIAKTSSRSWSWPWNGPTTPPAATSTSGSGCRPTPCWSSRAIKKEKPKP